MPCQKCEREMIIADAFSFAEDLTGLSLTIIEKEEIKLLVDVCIRQSKEFKADDTYNGFRPSTEAVGRFLNLEYGVDDITIGGLFVLQSRRKIFIWKNGYDGYGEFFRKRQEERFSW